MQEEFVRMPKQPDSLIKSCSAMPVKHAVESIITGWASTISDQDTTLLTCSEAEDSSDSASEDAGTLSSASEVEYESDSELKNKDGDCCSPRLPSESSDRFHSDRRASTTSRRGISERKIIVPPRRSSIHSQFRSDSGPRSFGGDKVSENKPQPPSMKLEASTECSNLPHIQVEQVFDQPDVTETPPSPRTQRLAARSHMLQALGRHDISSEDNTNCSTTPDSEPLPSTPDTAFHRRITSCPTPTSPKQLEFEGEIKVMVTPPTPQPQKSPLIGVVLQNASQSPYHSTRSNSSTLEPPVFDLAPGRTQMIVTQQKRSMYNTLRLLQQRQQRLEDDVEAQRRAEESYGILYGVRPPTTLRNSQMQASSRTVRWADRQLQRQQPEGLTKAAHCTVMNQTPQNDAHTTPSWRRPTHTAKGRTSMDMKRASPYSQRRSAADAATNWRCTANVKLTIQEPTCKETCESGRTYISLSRRSESATTGIRSRKEGSIHQPSSSSIMSNSTRSQAAQSMLAKLGKSRRHLHQGLEITQTELS